MEFDLDRVIAEQEAAREKRPPFKFSFGGKKYELPAVRDLRADAAIAHDRAYEGMAILFGPDQWLSIQESPTTLTREAFRSLLNAYYEHCDGLTVGESSASSGSSTSTAGRSKQTSQGSTRGRGSRS